MNYLNELYKRILNFIGGARGVANEQIARLTRQAVIGRALQFYYGLVPPQLKVKDGEPDDNVFINYADTIVDKGVSFLFGNPLVIGVTVGGTDDDKAGEEFLERVWSQAQRDEEFQEMAQDAAIAGDAYLKINIEPDGSPRVTVGDPTCYELLTDPHDCSRVVTYRCTYTLTDASSKEYLFKEKTTRAADGKSWQVQQYESRDGGSAWLPVGAGVTWNFSFPPIFHCKNLPQPKSVYGKPDLSEAILRVIAYISRLDSMCGKIVRIHSSPKPWAKNLKKQDLEWGTDGMLFLKPTGTSAEAEIGLLEMSNDISTALAFRKVLREGLAEMTGVPEVATGKVESTGQLSGVALRILYGPLLDKTSKKVLRYGRMIKECAQALMIIGNIKNAKVKLNWADPLPGDELEKVNVAEGKQRVGFSQNTIIKELGGDPAHEATMREQESQSVGTTLLDAFNSGQGMDKLAA
jgi:hypothetical protein